MTEQETAAQTTTQTRSGTMHVTITRNHDTTWSVIRHNGLPFVDIPTRGDAIAWAYAKGYVVTVR